MKTKFGEISLMAVIQRIEEFQLIGEAAFLEKYAPRGGARSTCIAYGGEFFPAKAIIKASFFPTELPPELYKTGDAERISGKLGLEIVKISGNILETKRSAIDDLDELSGGQIPVQQQFVGHRYLRDGKIRAAVSKRANGHCEYCGNAGFVKKSDGSKYIETHHIISLADQGPDTLDNVIALCPNHHREAHLGSDWEKLEAEFKIILSKVRDK
jgi:hypothetical protein